MAQSRKRKGHHEYHHSSDIPAKQRTKGRIIWALLFGVFGLLIAFFAAGSNYIILIGGALVGSGIGYMIGKKMEEDSTKK